MGVVGRVKVGDDVMTGVSRRRFIGSCARHIAAVAAWAPAVRALAWAQDPLGRVLAREPFGYLEQVTDGCWALVSTPLKGERLTLCNGGIIAGRSGVLAIEGFFDPKGAAWLSVRARELTGKPLTHVVVTHFHADHTNGIAGYLSEGTAPSLRSTAATRDLVLQKNQPADPLRTAVLQKAVLLSPTETTSLDLGGRTVRLVPRNGHTPSDVTIELLDPPVVFCGDLVWNAMFPNYVDAMPLDLRRAVGRLLGSDSSTTYVPGHGAVARRADVDRYISVLDEVERAARRAHERGLTAPDAAAKFTLPSSLGEWALFNPVFFERAFVAWYRQFNGSK